MSGGGFSIADTRLGVNVIQITKSMQDENVLVLDDLIEWFTLRTSTEIERKEINSNVTCTYVKGDGWSITLTFLVGQYRSWSMVYQIEIEDNTLAVEFALVKDRF